MTSYLSAISYVHKVAGVHDPTKTFVIQTLLRAINRSKTADIRLPITRSVLHQLLRSLQHTNSSASQRTTFSTMFLLAFYGFFRVGELATNSRDCSIYVVQYCNVSFLKSSADIRRVKITLTRFKHNTNNRPYDIIIEREDSLPFCPVKSLLEYCKIRGSEPGPLFCSSDGSPITTLITTLLLHYYPITLLPYYYTLKIYIVTLFIGFIIIIVVIIINYLFPLISTHPSFTDISCHSIKKNFFSQFSLLHILQIT